MCADWGKTIAKLPDGTDLALSIASGLCDALVPENTLQFTHFP